MTHRRIGLLITLVLGFLVAPLAADAQRPAKVARIGVLSLVTPSREGARGFSQALHDLGWIEGQNLVFEIRSANGDLDRLPALAAELVQRQVDLMVAGSVHEIRAAQHATRTIPIVIAGTGDPVGAGFVASLARPGENTTGLSTVQADLTMKWLELLKEAAPRVSRVAILGDAAAMVTRTMVGDQERVSRAFGVRLHMLEVADPSAIEPAFAAITTAQVDAIMVLPSPRFHAAHQQIVDLVTRSRLPAIYPARWYVEAGGLLSYDRSRAEGSRRLAIYIDKILKGAKPSDLPIEQPTTFELVINLKTAQALGLTVPPTLLLQADEVIR
jgi:putative tryptophan/tyrosine transport system substrate-binding protein